MGRAWGLVPHRNCRIRGRSHSHPGAHFPSSENQQGGVAIPSRPAGAQDRPPQVQAGATAAQEPAPQLTDWGGREGAEVVLGAEGRGLLAGSGLRATPGVPSARLPGSCWDHPNGPRTRRHPQLRSLSVPQADAEPSPGQGDVQKGCKGRPGVSVSDSCAHWCVRHYVGCRVMGGHYLLCPPLESSV